MNYIREHSSATRALIGLVHDSDRLGQAVAIFTIITAERDSGPDGSNSGACRSHAEYRNPTYFEFPYLLP